MYGKTANSHAYMARVASHATKGSRRGFVDVETGVSPADILTATQLRDNLLRKRDAIQKRRDEIRESRGGKAEFQKLGREVAEICAQISKVNEKLRGPLTGKGFDYHFVAVARSTLTASEYERIAEKARQRAMEYATPDAGSSQ